MEKGLGPVVEELSVSPVVVSKISEGHIDEAWVKVLIEVDKRATTLKKSPLQANSKALSDIGPLLDKLLLKVTTSSKSIKVPANFIRRSSEYGTSLWLRSRL